jgi:hypothetical protein
MPVRVIFRTSNLQLFQLKTLASLKFPIFVPPFILSIKEEHFVTAQIFLDDLEDGQCLYVTSLHLGEIFLNTILMKSLLLKKSLLLVLANTLNSGNADIGGMI